MVTGYVDFEGGDCWWETKRKAAAKSGLPFLGMLLPADWYVEKGGEPVQLAEIF